MAELSQADLHRAGPEPSRAEQGCAEMAQTAPDDPRISNFFLSQPPSGLFAQNDSFYNKNLFFSPPNHRPEHEGKKIEKQKQTVSSQAGPTRSKPSRAEPVRAAPGQRRTKLSRAGPSRAKPNRAETSRAGPGRDSRRLAPDGPRTTLLKDFFPLRFWLTNDRPELYWGKRRY